MQHDTIFRASCANAGRIATGRSGPMRPRRHGREAARTVLKKCSPDCHSGER